MKTYQEVEHSLITKYRKEIWRPFMKAIRDYELVKENDHIAVCISGGKDSVLLAKCLEELQKHGKIKFKLSFLIMDPGYQRETLTKIKENLEALNLSYHIKKSDIFEVANKLSKDHPCYLCARMRRGFLYQKAQDLGCNKIALGHHFDDVIETILLSMFYGGEFKTMLPKLKSTNFEGMELIRPLYLVREEAIKSFWNQNEYQFINCACALSKKEEKLSKRYEIKKLLERLRKENPRIDQNIFKSSEKVHVETLLSYVKEGKETTFLDQFQKDE